MKSNINLSKSKADGTSEALAAGPSLTAIKKYVENQGLVLEDGEKFVVIDKSFDDQVIAFGHPDGSWEEFDPSDLDY